MYYGTNNFKCFDSDYRFFSESFFGGAGDDFIDISHYAKHTFAQVVDRYQWEKISQILSLGDLAKTTAAGVISE